MVSIGLVARGQRVDVRVVDQGPGAVSPGEALVPDAHMVVGDELWPGLIVISLVSQVRVHHAQGDRGQSHDKGQLLPQLVATAWKRATRLD